MASLMLICYPISPRVDNAFLALPKHMRLSWCLDHSPKHMFLLVLDHSPK
jgi:hypothetical protein